MRRALALILFFFTATVNGHESYSYIENADKLAYDTTLEMCKKHKFLHLFGMGGGMLRQVELIGISFSCSKKLTEDEMRSLLVEGVLILQNKINNEKDLRPYLSHYPYSPKGIKVAIFIDSEGMKPEELSYASATRGKIRYCNDKDFSNDTLLQESFEEALAKVDVDQIMQKKEPPSTFTRLKMLLLK